MPVRGAGRPGSSGSAIVASGPSSTLRFPSSGGDERRRERRGLGVGSLRRRRHSGPGRARRSRCHCSHPTLRRARPRRRRVRLLDTLRAPPRSRTASRRQCLAVRALVVLAAIGGALAGGHPTGFGAADLVLRALLAGTVTAFASRSAPWTWVAAAGIAFVASTQDTTLFLVTAVVFAAAAAASVLKVRNRVLGAVLGAVTITIVMRLPAWGPFGLPTLLAAVAIAPVVMSGFASTTQPTRRRVVWASITVLGVALAATALFGVAALRVRDDLDAGVAATKRGVAAARRGDTPVAAREFDRARALLASASDALDKPWARVGGVVPVVGQQEEALHVMAASATRLAATGRARGTRSRRRGAARAGWPRRSHAGRSDAAATRARPGGIGEYAPRPPCGRFPLAARCRRRPTRSTGRQGRAGHRLCPHCIARDRRRVGAPRARSADALSPHVHHAVGGAQLRVHGELGDRHGRRRQARPHAVRSHEPRTQRSWRSIDARDRRPCRLPRALRSLPTRAGLAQCDHVARLPHRRQGRRRARPPIRSRCDRRRHRCRPRRASPRS